MDNGEWNCCQIPDIYQIGVSPLFFRNICANDPFSKIKEAATESPLAKKEISDLLHAAAYDIMAEAEDLSLHGDIWYLFLALRLATDENPLGIAAELSSEPKGSIVEMASFELGAIHRILLAARRMVMEGGGLEALRPLSEYVPSGPPKSAIRGEALSAVIELAHTMASLPTDGDPAVGAKLCAALVDFYRTVGSGFLALDCAFRWSSGQKRLVPVLELDRTTLGDLVGYDFQKQELRANTELFMSRKAANNVLLYGDSGTGKSTSIRALLNEPGYVRRGLRMIELHKGQFQDIPLVLDAIRRRNYRFIIFMDDLSFEEFEVDYKYLKALIEGGIEGKPENVLIYATSNRRNLVREVWADRKKSSDDVHGADTMQEKLSLSDRFGVSIWYGAGNKEEYLRIVDALVRENGIEMEQEELQRQAMRWEISHGGFTGRTAKQFVQHLLATQTD